MVRPLDLIIQEEKIHSPGTEDCTLMVVFMTSQKGISLLVQQGQIISVSHFPCLNMLENIWGVWSHSDNASLAQIMKILIR